jgi:sugar-specific transcriptional regulator TrmB
VNSKHQKQIKNLLRRIGFSEKETKVYLATLELGKGTVSEVARRAGVGRTYGYIVLDTLVGKGLVNISGKNPKQEYVAESPRKLYEYLEKELKSQKEMLSEVKEMLPELALIHNAEDRPKVKFYEGIEGIKEVYEDTLNSKGDIVGFVTYEELHKAMPNYFPKYYKRRASKGIRGRGIVTDTPEAKIRERLNKSENRTTALVPKEFYFYPEINIYDDKVMIASWREKLGITIESGEIADAMKKIFKLAWIGALSIKAKNN